MCSKLRWCVLLTWNHPISWLSSTTLIVPLIQYEVTLELTGRSGSGSLTNIHFQCHATPPLAYQHPKQSPSSPCKTVYLLKNAPMCNQPSPTVVRNPADSTPADYSGGSIRWWGRGGVNMMMGVPSHLLVKSRNCDKRPLFGYFRQHQRFLSGCNQRVY